MRVLLLAPPGDQIFLRDVYCGSTSKGVYYWPPSDLMIQSGILKGHHDVLVLDAIAEKLSFDAALERAVALRPDAVLSLGSAISLEGDMAFLSRLKQRTGCQLLMSGDIFYFQTAEAMERYPFVDGVCLNYTTDDTLKLLAGDHAGLENVAYRRGDEVIHTARRSPKNYAYPPPLLAAFPNQRYSYPFMRARPLASVSTNFGCPYKCTFCAQGMIPFAFRSLESTLAELRFLSRRGVREVFFRDFTFNASVTRTKELMRRMIQARLGLS